MAASVASRVPEKRSGEQNQACDVRRRKNSSNRHRKSKTSQGRPTVEVNVDFASLLLQLTIPGCIRLDLAGELSSRRLDLLCQSGVLVLQGRSVGRVPML